MKFPTGIEPSSTGASALPIGNGPLPEGEKALFKGIIRLHEVQQIINYLNDLLDTMER